MDIIVYTFPFRGHSMQAIMIANHLSEKGHNVVVDANPNFFQYISPNIEKQECLYKFFSFKDDGKKNDILNCAEGVLVTTNEYVKKFNRKADLIIFDSMAYWGKCVADKLGIKSISLFTIQPFNTKHFNDYAFQYLKGYTEKYTSQKEFFRNLHVYEIVSKNKFKLNADFSFDDILSARGTFNVVLMPKSICKFADELEESYVAFSPLIEKSIGNTKKKDNIYIATGSMISSLDLIIECVDSLIGLGKEIHISSGAHIELLKKKYNGYNNVFFYEFAPQRELLAQASVFITHGGTNSICEAIAAKTPMISIPLVNDEFLNSEMIVKSGIGIELENDLTVVKNCLDSAYKELIQNDSYLENISVIANEINAKRAYEIIDKIICGEDYGKL